jgi:hypothetical protein
VEQARARVGICVGDCLHRSSRAETAELVASANTCPPFLSASRARADIFRLVTPTETQIGPLARFRLAQAGQASQGEAHLLRSHRLRRRSRLPCRQRRSSRRRTRSSAGRVPGMPRGARRTPSPPAQLSPVATRHLFCRWCRSASQRAGSCRRILVGSKRILQRTMHLDLADGSSSAT